MGASHKLFMSDQLYTTPSLHTRTLIQLLNLNIKKLRKFTQVYLPVLGSSTAKYGYEFT